MSIFLVHFFYLNRYAYRAQELLKQKRLEREEKEKQEQLDREKQRRVHGKEMTQIRQKYMLFLSYIASE